MYLKNNRRRRRDSGKLRYNYGRPVRYLSHFQIMLVLLVIGGAALAFYVVKNREALRPNFEASLRMGAELATQLNTTPTPTTNPNVLIPTAEYLEALPDVERALREWRFIAEHRPNDVSIHYRLTHLLIVNGHEEEALEWADRTILADPEDARGYAIKAMALDWNGEPAAAVALAYQALDRDPNSAAAYAFLAEAYADMGYVYKDIALEKAEQAVSLDAFSVDAHRNYGYALELAGDYEAASLQYQQAIRLAPNLPYLYHSLGRSYNAQNRPQEAIATFEEALRLAPEMASTYEEIGWTYYRYVGDYESAADYMEQCIDLDARRVSCWVQLGLAYFALEEWPSSASAMVRAIDIGSQSFEAHYRAGQAYVNFDRCDQGLPYLQAALDLTDDLNERAAVIETLRYCQAQGEQVNIPPRAPPVEGEEGEGTPTPEGDG